MSYFNHEYKLATDIIYERLSKNGYITTNQTSINYKSPNQSLTQYSYLTNNTIYYNAGSQTSYIGDGYCQYAQLNTPTTWGR